MSLNEPTEDLSPTRPTRTGILMVAILGVGVIAGIALGVRLLHLPNHSETIDAFVTVSSTNGSLTFTAGLIGGAIGGAAALVIDLVIALVHLRVRTSRRRTADTIGSRD
jgi:hypothetical protein